MKEQNLQSLCQHRHGGVPIAIGIGMKVETKEGEGSTFVVILGEGENK